MPITIKSKDGSVKAVAELAQRRPDPEPAPEVDRSEPVEETRRETIDQVRERNAWSNREPSRKVDPAAYADEIEKLPAKDGNARVDMNVAFHLGVLPEKVHQGVARDTYLAYAPPWFMHTLEGEEWLDPAVSFTIERISDRRYTVVMASPAGSVQGHGEKVGIAWAVALLRADVKGLLTRKPNRGYRERGA